MSCNYVTTGLEPRYRGSTYAMWMVAGTAWLWVAMLALLVLTGAATSRPGHRPVEAPVPPPQQVALVTDDGRTGAPPATLVQLGAEASSDADLGQLGGGAPKPTGGIGQPASYCKPSHCETPQPRIVDGISGEATYYCRPGISRCTVGYPFGMYAAAGPELRAMLGPDWRGRTVVVMDANGRGVLVQLIDFCACGGDHVIDLYWDAYKGMVNPVTVTEDP